MLAGRTRKITAAGIRDATLIEDGDQPVACGSASQTLSFVLVRNQ